MKSQYRFCNHCGSEYLYYISGDGCLDELNDSVYCSDCKKEIIKILKKIPKKFGWKNVGTDEVTLEQLLEWEKESLGSYRGIGIGLYDFKTDDWESSREIKGKDKFEGINFWLCEWDKSPEYSITKKIYWNLLKNIPVNPNEYFIDKKILLNPLKSYPKEVKSFFNFDVIPLSEPVGINFALRFFNSDK